MGFLIPIVLIVASNVLYNLFTKGTPPEANPFAALVVTYLTAAAVAAVLLFTHLPQSGAAAAFRSVNWTSIALGVCIVGLEFGYIQAYRIGWNISICSLVANIALAVLLLVIGVGFFKERLAVNQIIGIAICVAGLFFINRP